MAQLERTSRSHEYPRSPQAQQAHASSKFGQHVQENSSSGWVSKNSSPIYDRNYDHNKKSVFMKVKEKAKQLKHSLSGKKKHGMGIHDGNTTPTHDPEFKDAEQGAEDADYLGAPIYDSELAPGSTKQNSGQHQRADKVIPAKLALPNNMHTEVKLERQKSTSASKTASGSVSDATHTNVAASAAAGTGNVEGLKHLERTPEIKEYSGMSPQKYDKGVSVKEYFVRKLEPGEDEKAFSRDISDSSSPRKSPRQKSVVDKFRDAVSSLLWSEEQSDSTTYNDIKSSKNPSYNPDNPSPSVPVPSSISEETEEKTHVRTLQPN